jgi:putative FmdB family regulatory protein
MPTYEYECEKCHKVFEVFQSITAPALETCTDKTCGGKVRRLFSPGAGFIFKGSGFYQTDYRSESYKKAASADSSGSSASSSSSTKSETKSSSTPPSSSTGTTPASSPKPAD